MTQEEKEMLIKDLCGRLPYGVMVQVNDGLRGTYDRRLVQVFCDRLSCSVNVCNPLKECICIDSVKPYLRPLSSMTESEREELKALCDKDLSEFAGHIMKGHGLSRDGLYMFDKLRQLDWLNKNMFDYRDLIQKGFALEAPEGMYNN